MFRGLATRYFELFLRIIYIYNTVRCGAERPDTCNSSEISQPSLARRKGIDIVPGFHPGKRSKVFIWRKFANVPRTIENKKDRSAINEQTGFTE